MATQKRIQVGSIVRRAASPSPVAAVALGLGVGLYSRHSPRSRAPVWKIYWFKEKGAYWSYEDELELVL